MHDRFSKMSDSEFDELLKEALQANYEEKLQKSPANEELTSLYATTDEHKERMTQLFESARKKQTTRLPRLAFATTMAFLVLSLSTLTIFNETVRANLRNLFIEWSDEFVRFTATVQQERIVSYSVWRPTAIPFDYSYTMLADTADMAWIEYQDQGTPVFRFQYAPTELAGFALDVENATHTQYHADGSVFYVFVSTDDDFPSNILWEQQGTLFLISGFMPHETLLDIAISVEGIAE